jgi:lipid A ethanolaminephosphotransferase
MDFDPWRARLPRGNRWLWLLKLALLALFVVVTNEFAGRRSLPGYALFAFVWMLSIAALLHVAVFGGRIARIAWTLAIVVSTVVNTTFTAIYSAPLTFADHTMLLRNMPFANMVLEFYGPFLTRSLLVALIGVAAINLPPYARRARRTLKARLLGLSVQISPIVLMMVVTCLKHGEGTKGFAVQHKSLAFLGVSGIARVREGAPPARRTVTMPHSGSRPLKTIIVVMDESIFGDLVDINIPGGAPTGLIGRPDVINFGVMSSIANCSHESNVAFRYGIGRRDYLRQLDSNPSMWSYAKRAGFDTFYFDAQRTGGKLQNGMDPAEEKEIDHFVQLSDDVIAEERDAQLAAALRRAVTQASRPMFAFVNKAGAHFPFEGKYPASRGWFKPALTRDYFGNEADPRHSLKSFSDSQDASNREMHLRFKNSWMNAAGWNASRFFEVLLDGLDLRDTLIVYMADHGQDLHRDGRPGYETHCTSGASHPDQGRVPLAIITAHAETASRMRAAAERSFGRTSQFSVFPSMLRWMGYAPEAIADERGFDPPLESPAPRDNQQFLSTFFVQLGAEPYWNPCGSPSTDAEHATND